MVMERKWWTLLAVCLGTFMLLVDVTIVNVALPSIQDDLHASFAQLQWVVDAYALSLAALLLTAGSLADIFGRRLLFAIGVAIFTAGSLLCALANDPVFLVLSRAGQGIGGAIMFATSLALLAQAFQGRERGTALAVWGAVTGAAVAVGPVLGGIITTGWSWRGIFFVNIPIGVIAMAVTLMRVTESRDPARRRVDVPGFTLFTCALVALVYGLIRAGEQGWSDPGVTICLASAAVLLVAFVVAERLRREPMFDLSLFRVPTFSGGSVAAFAVNGCVYAMLLYLVLYLQDLLGYSALQTGLRLLIMSAASLPAAIVSGRLSSRVPVRLLIGVGLAMSGAGLLLMAGLAAGSGWTHLIPGMILAGLGSGLINPALASTAVGVVPHRAAGMASGINSTFRQVGVATGIAIYGTLFATRLTGDIVSGLRATPLASHAHALATAVSQGQGQRALGAAPAADSKIAGHAVRSAFVAGLNEILIVAGIGALVAAVVAVLLIRGRDFVAAHAPAPAGGPAAAPAPAGGPPAATDRVAESAKQEAAAELASPVRRISRLCRVKAPERRGPWRQVRTAQGQGRCGRSTPARPRPGAPSPARSRPPRRRGARRSGRAAASCAART
jgi:EmrB/QacA subfamily drug resistance transporter